MSRLKIRTATSADVIVEELYRELAQRMTVSPPRVCPVDFSYSFLQVCQAQTCGKCSSCRIGLQQLKNMFEKVLDGDCDVSILDDMERLASAISTSADCALGYESANMVLRSLKGFRDDYVSHIEKHVCAYKFENPVPCVNHCPAGVDIPGYIALVGEGRYADAVRLIRKDNPFPTACALVCEHPCESKCRRGVLDSPINIRGLKMFACDNAGKVDAPECAPSTGKKIAIVGGGPSGLSCAYYLQLMGHQTTVYESRAKLGGMLRYGIPSYRFPRERLQEDLDCILSTGVEVIYDTFIGKDITIGDLRRKYDAVYVAIGAHTDKKLGIPGENAEGVVSAVDMLRAIGDDAMPDYSGKEVIVIGGGNVAMDCARSSVRLGAKSVSVVYRRRKDDMTALRDEIDSAVAEGIEMVTLSAPVEIVTEKGKAVGLKVKPQLISKMKDGRFSVINASAEEKVLKADLILVAIGQDIQSDNFGLEIPVNRKRIKADLATTIQEAPGVFSGGDCVTGPATVIRAIAAGKTAAANIDQYLGFNHEIVNDIEIPEPHLVVKPKTGRVQIKEKPAEERKACFEHVECPMTLEEACQEAGRCLRCDHFGYGAFKGGREERW